MESVRLVQAPPRRPHWPWTYFWGIGMGLLLLGLLTWEIIWSATRPVVPTASLCESKEEGNAFRRRLGLPNGVPSCAIVGSAGFMRLQRLGNEIDSHDFVIRANLAPVTGFEPIVGSKTSMRVLNSEAIGTIFREKACSSDPSVRQSACPDYPVYLNTGNPWMVSEFKKMCPNVTAFDSHDLDAFDPTMHAQWQGLGTNLMSGAWALGIAMKLCPNGTTVYGVTHAGTFEVNNHPNASYHYYDDRKQSVHDSLSSSAQSLTKLAEAQETCMQLHTANVSTLFETYKLPSNVTVKEGGTDSLVDGLRHDLPEVEYLKRFEVDKCA